MRRIMWSKGFVDNSYSGEHKPTDIHHRPPPPPPDRSEYRVRPGLKNAWAKPRQWLKTQNCLSWAEPAKLDRFNHQLWSTQLMSRNLQISNVFSLLTSNIGNQDHGTPRVFRTTKHQNNAKWIVLLFSRISLYLFSFRSYNLHLQSKLGASCWNFHTQRLSQLIESFL